MESVRTIQFQDNDGDIAVGVVDRGTIKVVGGKKTLYDLAWEAIATSTPLVDVIDAQLSGKTENYDALDAESRLLAPVSHPTSPANFLLTGTGLTHIGSASTRNSMHHGVLDKTNPPKSDSMRLFEQGLEGGKPADGQIGAMPEWFFKGDSSCLVAPGAPLTGPNFLRSCAEEPEITGIYLIGPDGTPWRIGYTITNDLSDHETESLNFMYVAPSKLLDCAMGPELLIGHLPAKVEGVSRIIRDGEVVWEGAFESGEDRMSHSLGNLEHHHFRHRHFRRPGDLHAHLFGCPVMSFSDGFRTRDGDTFEFDIPLFGRALRNPVFFEPGKPRLLTVEQL